MGTKAKRGLLASAMAGFAVVAAAIVLTAASPAQAPADADEPVVAAVASAVESKASSGGLGSAASSSVAAHPGKKDDASKDEAGIEVPSPDETAVQEVGAPGTGASTTGEDATSEPQKKAAERTGTTSQPGSSTRHWVVDYAQVWVDEPYEVEDVPGHYEDVIEYRDVLVCLSPGCGFSTTDGNQMGAHSASHAIKGEDDSSGSTSQPYVAGSTWVDAITHIEYRKVSQTVESGGHWE